MNIVKKSNACRFLRVLAPVACIACTGCDVDLPSLRTATEKVAEYSDQQMPKEPQPPSTSQVDAARAALAHFASSRLKIIAADIEAAEKELSSVTADRKTMSLRVTELSGKVFADKDAARENALLVLLRDQTLNSLAAKYLGGDFSLMCNGFVSKVRNAYARQKMKEDAIAANKALFDATVGGQDAKEAKSHKEKDDEIRRIDKKVAEMERRLRYLRASILTSDQARRDRDREVWNIEKERDHLQRRVALLRSQKDISRSSSVRMQALMRMDNANRDVERRFKGEVTAFEVADEYEKTTVRKLESAIAQKEKGVSDRIFLLNRQKLFISSVASGIEKLGMESIKKIRADIETALVWKIEDVKRDGKND